MKKLQNSLLLLLFLAAFAASCGRKQTGDLVGVLGRPKWKGINPYGMVYVPSGTLHVGVGDEDLSKQMVSRPKSISIQGFFMDETEITNNEYRQFVDWVRDSLAHETLQHFLEDDAGDADKQLIDWEEEVDWEESADELQDLYYQGNERFPAVKSWTSANSYSNSNGTTGSGRHTSATATVPVSFTRKRSKFTRTHFAGYATTPIPTMSR